MVIEPNTNADTLLCLIHVAPFATAWYKIFSVTDATARCKHTLKLSSFKQLQPLQSSCGPNRQTCKKFKLQFNQRSIADQLGTYWQMVGDSRPKH